ncbi:hypothetical protein KCU98_g39, partial [Aureobasidium melanogenum]
MASSRDWLDVCQGANSQLNVPRAAHDDFLPSSANNHPARVRSSIDTKTRRQLTHANQQQTHTLIPSVPTVFGLLLHCACLLSHPRQLIRQPY